MTLSRFRSARSCFAGLLLILSVAGGLAAQESGPRQPDPITARIPAVGAATREGEIDVDGHVTETAWERAVPATRFVQGEPVEGADAEELTSVRVLYDERALYIGVVMRERSGQIADQLVRRDEWGQFDYFEVAIDPNNDRRTGYSFRVSAAGVQTDAYLYDDVREDRAWDAVWHSGIQRDSAGWSAELRIPLSQIRYETREGEQSWGINFTRRRLTSNERTYFALESRIRHGRVSVFGRLEGLRLTSTPPRLEIRPYALASARTAPSEVGDPFFDGAELGNQVGADLSYGFGQYTLDVTVNPDFGQVEVDPAVINLTAFETFFPEKRPFFVEDAQLFDYGRIRLFNSRRIGREPRGSATDDAVYQRAPSQTTILGAAKFTGRTSSGLTLGALTALTAHERGEALLAGASQPTSFTAEPRTEHGVFRAQQDFRDGATQVGGIFTALHRNLPADGSMDFLTTTALSAGFDFEHNWGGSRSRDWALWGFFTWGAVYGPSEALLRIQQSSNHYFQRPDATRFSIDSTRTSLGGVNWRLQFERRSAEHWTGAIWLAEVTSGFEVNDLGFWTQGERLDGGARIAYQEITPGRIFRSYRISAFTFQNFGHQALDDVGSLSSWKRAHKRGVFEANADFELLNYWEFDVEARWRPSMMSDVATRGGPLMGDPGSVAVEAGFGTDRRAVVAFRPNFLYADRQAGGYEWDAYLGIQVRPAPSVELELGPSFSAELDPAQYVSTTDDVGYAPTYGKRYLFADLRRRSFTLETRINATFSPTLSFELFAQPLISTGDYLTYKQLARAETFDFDVFEEGTARADANEEVRCVGGRTCALDGERYVDFDADGTTDFSFEDGDFNVRSFRMTAVARWEFRPGSTLFLVWQQDRRSETATGSFDFVRDFGDLWGGEAENLFIVKFSYWLGF